METKRDYIVRLRELLIARLNLDELRTLCFDIGLDYDSLEGGTKDSKIRELLSHVERRSKLAFLIERVKGQRPDLTAVAKSDRASQDELNGLVQMSREASSGLRHIPDAVP